MVTRFQRWAERRWRCARDITVEFQRGAFLRMTTPDGMVIAGRGKIYDYRKVKSGDLSGEGPDAWCAIMLTAEFSVEHLRRELRRTRRDACR